MKAGRKLVVLGLLSAAWATAARPQWPSSCCQSGGPQEVPGEVIIDASGLLADFESLGLAALDGRDLCDDLTRVEGGRIGRFLIEVLDLADPAGGSPVSEVRVIDAHDGLLLLQIGDDALENRLLERGDLQAQRNVLLFPLASEPNDPHYAQQEALRHIHLATAWLLRKQAVGVPVGVLDGEVDHPDLEVRSRVDYVTCQSGGTSPDHGNHVTGIVGALGDNDRFVTGVSWRTDLTVATVLDDQKKLTLARARAGLKYVVTQGARIVNMSWGTCHPDPILRRFIEQHEEVLFVAAAGNYCCDLDEPGQRLYPASFELPNLIAVGASTRENDAFWSPDSGPGRCSAGTNYGSIVDLVAPGVKIVGLGPKEYSTPAKRTGTSMSAPFVAGVGALVWAECPTLEAYQVKQILVNSTAEIPYRSAAQKDWPQGGLDAAAALACARQACGEEDLRCPVD